MRLVSWVTSPAHGSSQCFFQIPWIVLSFKTSLVTRALSSFWSKGLSTFLLVSAYEELTVLLGMWLCPIVHVVIPQTWAPSSGSPCFSMVIDNCKITSPKDLSNTWPTSAAGARLNVSKTYGRWKRYFEPFPSDPWNLVLRSILLNVKTEMLRNSEEPQSSAPKRLQILNFIFCRVQK